MSKRTWIGIAAVLAATFVVVGLLSWFGLPCGPSTCGLGGWLYDFQTMVAGTIAIIAAIIGIGGPILHHYATERDRHEQQADAVTYELLHFGAAIGTTLEYLVTLRQKKDHGIMVALTIPKIKRLFEDAAIMLNAMRDKVPGHDPEIMALLTWRIIQFRDFVAQAQQWVTLMEAEIDLGKVMIEREAAIQETVEDLVHISTDPFPPGVKAKARRGVWKPIPRPQKKAPPRDANLA